VESRSVILAGSVLNRANLKATLQDNSTPLALCAALVAVLLWSLIGCHDLFTWFLEVLPVLIGGHYTYALMPVFQWIKDSFHLDRNYYDRLGHFAQGFVPAFIAREVLLRWAGLPRGKMLNWLVFSCCMAISALYELFEFAAAKVTGTAADAFLGTQGDIWDTQWDMTWCLIGATCMLLFFTGSTIARSRN